MKGQFTIEYIVSFLLFISIISYIHLSTSKFLPDYITKANSELAFSDAYLISEILINDPGDPIDWVSIDDNKVKRIGLSDTTYNKTNLLNLTKIKAFCRNYNFVKEKLGLDRDFIIMIIDRDDNFNNVLCKSEVVRGRVNVTVKRIVAYTDGENFGLAEVIVQTW